MGGATGTAPTGSAGGGAAGPAPAVELAPAFAPAPEFLPAAFARAHDAAAKDWLRRVPPAAAGARGGRRVGCSRPGGWRGVVR
eukprot:gene19768-15932_t